jgi:protein-tyrosine phosphatase
MKRIDVHCHFLPQLDDGCVSVDESLTCLRMMVAAGYDRIFCTPHCGAAEFTDLRPGEVAERVRELQGYVDAAGIPIRLKPGGELRLSHDLMDGLLPADVPTFGHAGRYVLADIWEHDWPDWAGACVAWLQKLGYMVILAHPERMEVLRHDPAFIDHLAGLGLLFQGNLGPLGGGDSDDIVRLSRRYLTEGRYFMVGTDGHRSNHMTHRINGLRVIEELMGREKLEMLTVRNPMRLWGA